MTGRVWLFFALDLMLAVSFIWLFDFGIDERYVHWFTAYVIGGFKAACTLIWGTVTEAETLAPPVYWATTSVFMVANVTLSVVMMI